MGVHFTESIGLKCACQLHSIVTMATNTYLLLLYCAGHIAIGLCRQANIADTLFRLIIIDLGRTISGNRPCLQHVSFLPKRVPPIKGDCT